MWTSVTLLLFVGVAVGTLHQYAWETDNEYQYTVRSRTLTGLDKLKNQFTGFQLKGLLTVQVKSPNTLQAKLSQLQYAHIHKTLIDGPDSEIPEMMLKFHPTSISEKPFLVNLKEGRIHNLLVDRDVPTWEVNLIKSFMSQFQINTKDRNLMKKKNLQTVDDENTPMLYKSMDYSVDGQCEVQYEIKPLFDEVEQKSNKVPFPSLRGDGELYEVRKLKNYENCLQRQIYHHGFRLPNKENHLWKEVPIQLSQSDMIISGDMDRFTIQIAKTRNQISVNPDKTDSYLGTVYSMIQLTLLMKDHVSKFAPINENNLVSRGNLLYTNDAPFSNSEDQRKYMQWNLIATDSSDNSQEDNLSTSSEDNTKIINVQPRTPLYEAPNIPLLPFFVGDKGKPVSMNNEVNIVKRALHLISQMSDDLNSNQTLTKYTLEKYTILKNLLRTMNRKQYSDLENMVKILDNTDNQHRENTWNILHDAVAQAGTGPALLTLKSWLKNRKIEGFEAARLISHVPKSVVEPSKEYVKALMDIVTDSLVSQQKFLNVSAPLALAELIRNSHVNQEFYPVYSFGPMIRKDDNELLNQSISYMANQLKQALEENDEEKVHTFIVALGMIGHPRIVSVLEPYIEGKKPVSNLQRFLMVASMATLGKIKPKLVNPIMYKIYSDKRENQEVRCMAVHQFIMTDPPMALLQRVAKNTYIDKDEQVNSVIKTTIESIANAKQPELKNLAEKAQSVKHLLNPRINSFMNSKNYYKDMNNMFVKNFNLLTIDRGSQLSFLPTFLRLNVNTILNSLEQPTLEAEYTVSDVEQLLKEIKTGLFQNKKTNEETLRKTEVEQIARTLKLKPEVLNKLEGNMFLNTMYGSMFYPFNNETINKVVKNVYNAWHENNIWKRMSFNNIEKTLSFPMENGLPFVYTVELPNLIKLQVEMNKESSEKRNGVFDALMINNVQKRVGFVSPFEHQNYVAGIDRNEMMQLPVKYELDSNWPKLGLKLRLNKQNQLEDQPLLHYSNVPYTTRQDILNFQPIGLDKNTHQVLVTKRCSTEVPKDMLSIKIESDGKLVEENRLRNLSVLETFRNLGELNEQQYQKLNVLLNFQKTKDPLRLDFNYEKIKTNYSNQDSQEKREEQMHVFPITDSKPNSANRKNEIIKGLSKMLTSNEMYIFDFSYNNLLSDKQEVLTLGLEQSDLQMMNKKLVSYVYWNSQKVDKQEDTQELCMAQELQYSLKTSLDFEYVMKNPPKTNLKAQALYGQTCDKGEYVTVVGDLKQSDKMHELIDNSSVVKLCRQEIEKGNKVAPVCQEAIKLAQTQDQMDFIINIPDYIYEIIERIINCVLNYIERLSKNTQILKEKYFNFKKITLRAFLSPNTPLVQFLIHQKLDLNSLTENNWRKNPQEELNAALQNNAQNNVCTLDKKQITTFDQRTYPVQLGPVKHVLMISSPQQDLKKEDMMTIPEKMKVAVVAEDQNDDTKGVTVLLGPYKFKLETDPVDNHPIIVYEKKVIEIPRDETTYKFYDNGDLIYEIVGFKNGVINVQSKKYGVRLTYDGKHVQIEVDDRFHNTVRGLCGNYDSNPSTDFLIPQNCILKKPEEFAAMYALIEEDTQGPVVENRRKAEQAKCRQLDRQWQRNIINKKEVERLMIEEKNWIYNMMAEREQNHDRDDTKSSQRQSEEWRHNKSNFIYRTRVVEEGDLICFTTKPVLACPDSLKTKNLERNPQTYQLYCPPRNEESLELKRRVEQGANPDLSRKPVTRSHVFRVPIHCG